MTSALLHTPGLSGIAWLRHGFSTRAAGLQQPGKAPWRHGNRLRQLRQIHSALVWQDPAPGTAGDGMMTQQRGAYLTLRTADCCPVLLVDVRRRAVAAVHAGWRGALARIAEKAVGEMRAAYGTDPADVRVALGPCLQPCCCEVGMEVVEAFCAAFPDGERFFGNGFGNGDNPLHERYPALFLTGAPPGHPPDHDYDTKWNPAPKRHLDLHAVLRSQLMVAGVPGEAVETVADCTHCRNDLYYSHRRSDHGRMLSAIGVAE